MKHTTVILLTLTYFISGCSDSGKVDKLVSEMEFTKTELASIKLENEKLKKDLAEVTRIQKLLRDRLVEIYYSHTQYVSADLHPGDENFATIHSNLGRLTVSLKDIKEYANGSKIKLQFGNPLAADLVQLSIDVEWGEVDSDGLLVPPAKTKNVKLIETFNAGSWTTVEVALDGFKPDKVGIVTVKNVYATRIFLRK